MLVLSRRPNEKILFPGVGISVEIVQTKGNTVRVGIEAPEDIRVLRGELAQQQPQGLMRMNRVSLTRRTDRNSFDDHERTDLAGRIDEIGMALALAQNQNQQGLAEHVDMALMQAIERLNELKEVIQPSEQASEIVCESRPVYSMGKDDVSLEFERDSPNAFRLEFEFAV